MASEMAIKAGIAKLVGSCSLWTIGLTNDPDQRELEVGSPMGWRQFSADDENVARNVAAHFVSKGMDGDTGGHVARPKYVYIYMSLQERLDDNRSNQKNNRWHIGR